MDYIIEPCCIDRQLPTLLRSNGVYHFFSSNGDWTFEKLMSAVSYMVSGGVMVLAIPEVDVFLLRTIRTYIVKGWYRGVILLTSNNQEELVTTELGKYQSSVVYVHDERYKLSQFALNDGEHSLVIQGPLLLEMDNHYSTYSAYFGKDAGAFVNAMGGVISRVRTAANHKLENINDELRRILSLNLSEENEGI